MPKTRGHLKEDQFVLVCEYGLEMVLDAMHGASKTMNLALQRRGSYQGCFPLDGNVEVRPERDSEESRRYLLTIESGPGKTVKPTSIYRLIQQNIFKLQKEKENR